MDESQNHYAKYKSQTEKISCSMIPFIYQSRKGKTTGRTTDQ